MGSAEDRAEGAAHHCSRATFTGEFHRGGTTGPPPFGKRPAKTNASHQISHTCLILAPMGLWAHPVSLAQLRSGRQPSLICQALVQARRVARLCWVPESV